MTINMIFSRKHFIVGMFIGIILLISAAFSLSDNKLHLVFCDVGQGDSAYIRAPNGMDMLIDGGPNEKILSCLGKHMPFYDRTIDLVVLTHPQNDHLAGLVSVLERYTVKNFIIGVEGNSTQGYQKLVSLLSEKKIPIRNLYSGDEFALGEVKFTVLWPERKWVISKLKSQLGSGLKGDKGLTLSLDGLTPGSAVLGISTDTDLNLFSYNLHLKYRDFDVLFTGDADSKIQTEIGKAVFLPDIEVLKVPHHGSKTGLLPEFLDKLKPETAVISVGKNSYGHPAEQTINQLQSRNIMVRRTDQEGDIVISQ